MTVRRDPMHGLRVELLRTGARHHARRRRRNALVRRAGSAVGAFGVVAAAAAVAFGWGGSDSASASVLVHRDGNMWEVVVAADDVTAAMVEAALADNGVDAVVDAVPVGPSRVGQFVSGDVVVEPSGNRLSAPSVRFPVGQRRAHLLFGRPAEPSEAYVAVSDAFADGEPLECHVGIWGQRASAALPQIEAAFNDVTVIGDEGRPATSLNGVVGDVLVAGPGRAVVRLHADGAPRGLATGSSECPVR